MNIMSLTPYKKYKVESHKLIHDNNSTRQHMMVKQTIGHCRYNSCVQALIPY